MAVAMNGYGLKRKTKELSKEIQVNILVGGLPQIKVYRDGVKTSKRYTF